MAFDINKQLNRARRALEGNKLEDAMKAYQSILDEVPGHFDSLQALGDAHTRLGQAERVAFYYGLLFDRFSEAREENKALAIYSRALKNIQQSADRMARYALLLQKQNRSEEAIEQYTLASELFQARGQQEAALDCLERIAQLDPDDAARQSAVAGLAERLGKTALAARSYLRAGQLAEVAGDSEAALALLARAQQLAPGERSPTLLYAQALMRRGDAAAAAKLLEPFADGELDAMFLEALGEALMRSGALERAAAILQRLPLQHPGTTAKLFGLADCYLAASQDSQAVALLQKVQQQMVRVRRENDFAAHLDALAESYPASIPLTEFGAEAYAENVSRACETLDKLLEIDPYDSRHQQRIAQVEGRADEALLTRIRARFSQVATHATQGGPAPSERIAPQEDSESAGGQQTLEDLIVQAEIFLQYSLQVKAIEQLQKIVELFPGEQEGNERLRHLCKLAHWWPEGATPRTASAAPASARAEVEREIKDDSADTMRDLAKISEINQSLFRLASPRAVLAAAVNEMGRYLRATRCLAVIGVPGKPPQMASEFCAPGVEPAASASLVRLLAQLERPTPDPLGGLSLQAVTAPVRRALGLESILGVVLTDRETQTQAGMVIAGFAAPHTWRPNEKYFLQAIGDQMLLLLNHVRLRTLTRTLGAVDSKTGLLARVSYQDCLLGETQSAKSKGTSLLLALVQIDHGPDLLRQHGELELERHLEQLARVLEMIVRHGDLAVKYTSWTISFILPDTALAGAGALAEKLRKAGAQIPPPWDGAALTLSASVAEALVRPNYDAEDTVTELINRVAAGLEETDHLGGDTVVVLKPPGNEDHNSAGSRGQSHAD